MGFIGNLIGNIIGIIGGSVLAAVVAIFQVLSIYVPSQIDTGFAWIASFISYGNGILPMGTLIACLVWLLAVFILKYKVNLFLHTIFPFIPLIGKRVDLPTVTDKAIAQHNHFKGVMKGRDSME